MNKAPEWLGLICQGRSFEEVDGWLVAAAAYGFTTVQPAFFWSGYTPDDFTKLRQRLDTLGLKAAAFGVYSDIYKWHDPVGAVFESTCADLETAIRCAPLIQTPHVVSWCGTHGDFGEPCEMNRSPEVIEQFQNNLKRIQPLLQPSSTKLLFEPWRDHILGDEVMTAQACQAHAPDFGVVLDFPNFISPSQWPDREERMKSILQYLQPHIGIVHLKDMTVDDSGGFELPMFGRGEMTEALAGAIRPFIGKVPVIAEHMASPDDLPELLLSVERYFS